MFVGRVVGGALLGAVCCALGACGERVGDPVVLLVGDQNLAGEGSGPGSRPTGLCGACDNSTDCGDANDACIRRQDEGFCGRDCDDQRDCPEGYECVQLNDDRIRQCVPRNGCPAPRPAPSVAEVQRYVLSRVNAERVARDQLPLERSTCLDELARASALDLARTDEPLGKYVKECDPIWPACQCGWSAEAEVAISAYELDWRDAVDHAVESYGANADTHFVQALLADDATQVGIGFWLSGDELWIALSFG
jgi:hypothetical protein